MTGATRGEEGQAKMKPYSGLGAEEIQQVEAMLWANQNSGKFLSESDAKDYYEHICGEYGPEIFAFNNPDLV